jgi:site-specific recombinase XerD
MKASANLVLDLRRPKKDGSFSVCLRIVHKSTSAYITTEFSVLKEHWDDENLQIKKECKKYSNLVRINNSLTKKRLDAIDIIEKFTASGELSNLSMSDLKARILNQTTRITFRDFNNKIIAELKMAKKLGNASCYEQAQSFLDKHTNKKELTFEEINYALLKQLEAKHLAKKRTLNSLSFYLRTIRSTYNRAIKEGVVKRDYYPFTQYSIKYSKTVKRAIPKKDIDRIRDMKLKKGSNEWHARNYFMFSFYNIGMNFADMAYLKKSNIIGDRMQYTRAKTGKEYSIKLTQPAKEILSLYLKDQEENDYIFPIIKRDKLELKMKDLQNERKNYNKYLKTIAKTLEIKSTLTSYVARHSWATIAKDLNVPISVISEGLGHEDIKTTQIYLDSFDADVIDKANELITG